MRKRNENAWSERLRAIGCRGTLPSSLTAAVVEAARRRPMGVRYVLLDGEVPGLELRVGATGTASFLLWYRTKAGVRRHQKIGVAGAVTLDDARARARKLLVSVADGQDPTAKVRVEAEQQRTVRKYLEDVFAPLWLAGRKAGEDTKARILSTWKPLLDVPLKALSRDRIAEVLLERKAHVSGGTMRRTWNPFRKMLAHATERKALPPELAPELLRQPDCLAGCRDKSRVRWLGERDTDHETAAGTGERKRFEDGLHAFTSGEPGGGDFLRCAVRLALATGLRRGELVRLTDAMINLRERTLSLPAAITKGNKDRVVYLHDAAIAAITRWREVRKTLAVEGIASELFPGDPKHWERRLTAHNREFHRLCAEASIEDLHFHDLRHDFAVRFLRAGGTLAQLREALGHSSIAVTEKYGHVVPSYVRKAVLAM